MEGKMIKSDFDGRWAFIQDCALARFASRTLGFGGFGDYDRMYTYPTKDEQAGTLRRFAIEKVAYNGNEHKILHEDQFYEIKQAFVDNPDLEVTLHYREITDPEES